MNSIYTEYSNLTDEHKQWLDGCGATHPEGQTVSEYEPMFTRYLMFRDKMFILTNHRGNLITGDEFCERVAEILGIDKPTFGKDFDLDKDPFDDLESYPYSKGTVTGSKMIDEQRKAIVGNLKPGEAKTFKTYPHKTYRVLDSLDGIPLDTRIPLSEWIPPFGADVLFIFNEIDTPFFTHIDALTKSGLRFNNTFISDAWKHFGGHWMRIV